MNESLENSNKALRSSTDAVLISLQEKQMDFATSERAKAWYPRADTVRELSKRIWSYIERLKGDLSKEAGFKQENDITAFDESHEDAVNTVFVLNRKGEELFERLEKYKSDVMAVHAHIDSAFRSTLLLTLSPLFINKGTQTDFTNTFFKDIPFIAAVAMLNRFQNSIASTENAVIKFCDYKCGSIIDFYDSYYVIVGQSSSIVKEGEKIEITAGVGAFSKAAKPEIQINQNIIPLRAEGSATYTFKASAKPGKHYIPVKISFTDQDGKQQTIEKNVEYTVIKDPCEDN